MTTYFLAFWAAMTLSDGETMRLMPEGTGNSVMELMFPN